VTNRDMRDNPIRVLSADNTSFCKRLQLFAIYLKPMQPVAHHVSLADRTSAKWARLPVNCAYENARGALTGRQHLLAQSAKSVLQAS